MRVLAVIACMIGGVLHAQVPSASLDSSVMRIGEQVHVLLAVEIEGKPTPGSIEWPRVGERLHPKVEVLHQSDLDSTVVERSDGAQQLRLSRSLTITAFDTGYFAIPPFVFTVDGKPMETAALLLEVRSVPQVPEVSMHDLKPLRTLPFSIAFLAREYGALVLGGLLLLGLSLLFIKRILAKDTSAAPKQAAMPEEALHVRVVRELRAVEQERLWQQGQHKAYHSRITDLLRGYIEARYDIRAMERTTDELMAALRVSAMDQPQRTSLENMLRLADLVKFAKAAPSPAENEQMVASAIQFVEHTSSTTAPSDHAR